MLFFIELINTSDAVPPQKNFWSTEPISRHQLKPLTLKGKLKERLATVLYGEFQPVQESRSKSSRQNLAAIDFYLKK